jgi:hypothetical protein
VFRREKDGALTAAEGAALHTEVQYWHDQIEALERLADEQGYAAVNLRPLHW